jgi:hypothetical protein
MNSEMTNSRENKENAFVAYKGEVRVVASLALKSSLIIFENCTAKIGRLHSKFGEIGNTINTVD